MAIIVRQPISLKTVELIIYITAKWRDKPKCGAIHLNKALCLSDVFSYRQTGKQITNLTYIKQEFGPTPNPRQFLPIRNFLIEQGDAELLDVHYFGQVQKRLVPKRPPNLELFTKDEIVLIDQVLEEIAEKSATDLSDYTHRMLAYNFADEKEELPLFSFLLTSVDPEPEDYEWAEKTIKEYEESINKAKK
jgi:hypothetical protein